MEAILHVGVNCVPSDFLCQESCSPEPQNVTAFTDRVFDKVI